MPRDFCMRCGECCRGEFERGIVLSGIEKEMVEFKLQRPIRCARQVGSFDDVKYIWKEKGPCPFLKDKECTIYDTRPYTCRAFHCGRLKEGDPAMAYGSQIQNLMASNPEYRKYKTQQENEAARWANSHGWRLRRRVRI